MSLIYVIISLIYVSTKFYLINYEIRLMQITSYVKVCGMYYLHKLANPCIYKCNFGAIVSHSFLIDLSFFSPYCIVFIHQLFLDNVSYQPLWKLYFIAKSHILENILLHPVPYNEISEILILISQI